MKKSELKAIINKILNETQELIKQLKEYLKHTYSRDIKNMLEETKRNYEKVKKIWANFNKDYHGIKAPTGIDYISRRRGKREASYYARTLCQILQKYYRGNSALEYVVNYYLTHYPQVWPPTEDFIYDLIVYCMDAGVLFITPLKGRSFDYNVKSILREILKTFSPDEWHRAQGFATRPGGKGRPKKKKKEKITEWDPLEEDVIFGKFSEEEEN